MKRGDIVTVAAGSGYAGKPRPAVLVQADGFDYTLSAVLCPFTTDPVNTELIRLPVHPSPASGLFSISWIMVDKIDAVRRDKIGKRIGILAADDQAHLDRALLVFLGLTG